MDGVGASHERSRKFAVILVANRRLSRLAGAPKDTSRPLDRRPAIRHGPEQEQRRRGDIQASRRESRINYTSNSVVSMIVVMIIMGARISMMIISTMIISVMVVRVIIIVVMTVVVWMIVVSMVVVRAIIIGTVITVTVAHRVTIPVWPAIFTPDRSPWRQE